MSTFIVKSEPPTTWQPPPVEPLNEKMWQAWEARGRYDDRRIAAAQVNAVRWISIAALLAAAVIWSRLGPYEVVVRFIVAIGAVVGMMSAVHSRNYFLVVVFGALVLLFNPVMPMFAFAGDWQRALVAVCVAPFIASLNRGKRKPAGDA